MAKSVTIGKLPIIVPKDSAFRIETPPDFIKLHCLMLAVAKRGGGKTVALTSMLRNMQKHKLLDRMLLVTPTYESNKDMYKGLPLEEEDIFQDPRDKSIVPRIIEIVENEMKAWEEYQEKMKLRRELEKALKGTKSQSDIYKLNPQLLIECFNYDILNSEPPTHKYNGRRPVIALFVDDAQGSGLLNDKVFQHLCLRHRHIGKGLGISVFMAVQTYKAQCGGMPLAIRDNITQLLLFRTKNMDVLQNVFKEVADDVSEEAFYAAYNEATKEDHSFLCVDFHPARGDQFRFRKCFDTYIFVADSCEDRQTTKRQRNGRSNSRGNACRPAVESGRGQPHG